MQVIASMGIQHLPFRSTLLLVVVLTIISSTSSIQTNASSLKVLLGSTESIQRVTSCYESHYLCGVYAYNNQDLSGAINHLTLALSGRPELARWYLAQALEQDGQLEKALEVLDLDSPSDRILFAKIVADSFRQISGMPAQIIRAIEEHPDMILAYANRLLSQEEYDEAERWVRKVPDYDTSVGAQLITGRVFFYKRQFDQAELIFSKLYKSAPGSPDVLLWYGKTLVNTGRSELAIGVLEKAVSVVESPSKNIILTELSIAYASSGECEQARTILQRVLNEATASDNIQSPGNLSETIESICSKIN